MITSLYVDDVQLHRTARCRVTKLHGLGLPAPRTERVPRGSRHGAIDQTRYYEGRVLDLEGALVEYGTDLAGLWAEWDALKRRLQLGADRVVRFRRQGQLEDEQVTVRVASPLDDDVSVPKVIRWGVSLFAGDPRIYGAALRSAFYDPAASLSGGGVAMPLTFPLTFTTTTVTQLDLTNLGNFATPPVLTIKGPVVNPVVDNNTTGESLYITYSLGSSDTVVVDVAARSVKLNGASRLDLLNTQSTKWWELQPGTNRVRLRGTGMVLGVTQLTVQHRDARI